MNTFAQAIKVSVDFKPLRDKSLFSITIIYNIYFSWGKRFFYSEIYNVFTHEKHTAIFQCIGFAIQILQVGSADMVRLF